jgi:hypothetical protein
VKTYIRTVLAAALVSVGINAPASAGPESSDGMWRFADAIPDLHFRAEPWVRPQFFQGVFLDHDVFHFALDAAPMEFTPDAFERPVIIELPTPAGTFESFEVWESPVMELALAVQLPGVKTWAGQGIDDPTATLRFDITPQGFHAQVLSAEGSYQIDPYSRGDTSFYAVYGRDDLRAAGDDGWSCLGSLRTPGAILQGRDTPVLLRSGTFLQTYRTCVAATGEYTSFHGGTQAAGQAAIVTAINRVTGVYERELAIRLTLIANNINVVYTSAAGDPYTNSNGVTMLGQNQANLDAIIGTANYDIGHVFSTGGGGVASLGVVCVAGSKARGVTGLPSPTGDIFYIDYVAHEMGHQFGAFHSFNGLASNCNGNRTASSAYEPGSGSTIMSYAGICGADNLQTSAHDYFVHKSFDDILAFSTGATGGCPANVATGNTVPTANAGADFTIPFQTPFMLTGSSTDPDADSLTYCWEQRNLGAAQSAPFTDNGTSPFIRSFPPTSSPTRIIPRVSNLIANTFAVGETLPQTSRSVNFRLTVRDNRAGGGGVNTDDMVVTTTNTAGPFLVTFPNAFATLSGNITVTWNVANTSNVPVNCANVKIELSTDGGNNFTTTLLASTPNDGSEVVALPAINNTLARIRVMAVGNIFFDISNVNFTIVPPAPPGAFSLTAPANGATGIALEPTLAWSASSGAASYNVVVDDEPALSLPNVYTISTSLTSTVIPPATLSGGITYFWRVTATNGAGNTIASPNPASFTTVPPAPPGPFALTAPFDGETNVALTPTFTWNPATDAVDYLVTVDTDAGFAPPFIYQTTTASTSDAVPPATLAEGTTYFWRVVANNLAGNTAGSPDPSTFSTVPPALCIGDADGDGDRDFADVTSVLANFGNVNFPVLNGLGDADHDGSVTFADVTAVLANFGMPC